MVMISKYGLYHIHQFYFVCLLFCAAEFNLLFIFYVCFC